MFKPQKLQKRPLLGQKVRRWKGPPNTVVILTDRQTDMSVWGASTDHLQVAYAAAVGLTGVLPGTCDAHGHLRDDALTPPNPNSWLRLVTSSSACLSPGVESTRDPQC